MLSTKRIPVPEVTSLRISRQFDKIDILVTVNEKVAVIIEDKTQTQQHSDQLRRYLEKLRSGPKLDSIVTIYLQTGDQCDYDMVEKDGYVLLHRRQLIDIFEPHIDRVTSDILRDFYAHLVKVEGNVESYRNVPYQEWNGHSPWIGFFKFLHNEFSDTGWGYVSNPKGGFMGFWWKPIEVEMGKLYPLLEKGRLKIKLTMKEPAGGEELAKKLSERLVRKSSSNELEFVRPQSMRRASNMTIAVLRESYVVADEDGILDTDSTIQLLRKVKKVVDSIAD